MPRPVRLLLYGLGGLSAICFLLVVVWGVDVRRHDGRVARNVSVGGIRVGGMTVGELDPVVNRIVRLYDDTAVQVRAPKGSFQATTDELGVSVSEKRTVAAVMRVGRTGAFPGRIASWLLSPLRPREAPVRVSVDLSKAWPTVVAKDPGPRTEPTEPSVTGEGQKLRVVDGKPGRGIDPRHVAEAIPDAARHGVPIVVDVDRGRVPPRHTEEETERLLRRAEEAVAKAAPLPLAAGTKTATAKKDDVTSWIRSRADDAGMQLVLDPKAVIADLERLLKGAGEPAVDASFSVEGSGVVIHPGHDGTTCCGAESVTRLERVVLRGFDHETVTLPLRPDAPKRSTEAAQALKVVEPVSSFTTQHPAGQPRVRNIHRIADILRGTVIEPGETFSVNGTVGRRTVEKGFVSAPVIEEGKFSEGVGGGVSQFATTLFNAAFFAGLDFAEYQSHSIYISRYPYGREATVNYPKPDLRIRNNTPYGILIWPSYTEKSITVTLYSTKYFAADQTGQTKAPSGACTRVTTERTRTRVTDGERTIDHVTAVYRPAEGVNCR